jgi:hypothetical protein
MGGPYRQGYYSCCRGGGARRRSSCGLAAGPPSPSPTHPAGSRPWSHTPPSPSPVASKQLASRCKCNKRTLRDLVSTAQDAARQRGLQASAAGFQQASASLIVIVSLRSSLGLGFLFLHCRGTRRRLLLLLCWWDPRKLRYIRAQPHATRAPNGLELELASLQRRRRDGRERKRRELVCGLVLPPSFCC